MIKIANFLISQQQIIETIIKPPAEISFFFIIAEKVTEQTAKISNLKKYI